jgi:hypothetical protein
MNLEVVCIESEAFYQLIKQVVDRMKSENGPLPEWVDAEEAMNILSIKTSALQFLRHEGKIEFSQPSRKIILYRRSSLYAHLEKHSQKTF